MTDSENRRALLRRAHARLASAAADRSQRPDPEDPQRPETVWAMQIALNLPRTDPPPRNRVLVAAARAVVAACLDPRAGQDGTYAQALCSWYGLRIRKIARRSRGASWDKVQALPGVTVDGIARAFAPTPVSAVPAELRKLQIGGTELPADEEGSLPPLRAKDPALYVNAELGMSAGKVAAQVGHASMLLAGALPFAAVERWAADSYALGVREMAGPEFARACAVPGAVVVVDAGFTEIAPGSATVCALAHPFQEVSIPRSKVNLA